MLHTHRRVSTSLKTCYPEGSILFSPRRSNSRWSRWQFFSSPARSLVIHAPPGTFHSVAFILIAPGIFFQRESAILALTKGFGHIRVAISLAGCGGQGGRWKWIGIRGWFSRNARVERWMNDVWGTSNTCAVFSRESWPSKMLGVVGVGAGNSQSGVDAGGGEEEGEWIWLCVATSRLDLSPSPSTGDEKLGGREGIPLYPPRNNFEKDRNAM